MPTTPQADPFAAYGGKATPPPAPSTPSAPESDPFAAYGGKATGAPGTPPAATGGQDEGSDDDGLFSWNNIKKTIANIHRLGLKGELDRERNEFEANFAGSTPQEWLIGAGKGLAQAANFAERGLPQAPHYENGKFVSGGKISANDPNLKPANWGETFGMGGETMLEFLSLEAGERKIATNLAERTGSLIKPISERLASRAATAKFLENRPILRRLVQEGIKSAIDQGVTGGGQATLHGATPTQALTTGLATGVTGGAATVGLGALGEGIEAIKPETTKIAGVEMPRMASQRPEGAPDIVGAPPRAMAKAQQAGSKQAIRNIAQEATYNSLERLNAGRTGQIITDPSRLLQETPFTFEIKGTEPRTGTELVPAGQIAGEAEHGFKTTNPHEAQAILSRLESVRDSPQFETFTADQKKAITDPINSLNQQFEMFHAQFEPGQLPSNFRPVDSVGQALQVRNFGEAADQIEMGAVPVYQELNRLSNGRWTGLREQMKNARKVMMRPGSLDAYNQAAESYKAAADGQARLFANFSDRISPIELQRANQAWRDAKILDQIHIAVEGAFNSIPENIAERTGIERTIKGGRLQNRLGRLLDRTPQTDVERVIGKQGLDNLYQIADLLKDPARARDTGHLLREVGRHMTRRIGRGAFIGGAIGSIFGQTAKGAAAGALAEDVARGVFRYATVSPRVGNMVDYAIRNNIDEKVAAPLIAAAMQVQRENPDEEPNQ